MEATSGSQGALQAIIDTAEPDAQTVHKPFILTLNFILKDTMDKNNKTDSPRWCGTRC
jgi:hypothetical protein